jgi:coiled-coil domain-containing protein 12
VKQVKFRNYEPHADELREEGEGDSKVKRAKVGHTLTDTVEGEVANIVSKALEESEVVNLVAKRPNWDLKRDVEAKLNKLNRATQIAIVKMNRQRMEEEEEEEEGEEN